MSVEASRSTTTMGEKIADKIGGIVVASLEATAQISIGQGLLRVADRFLWVVEKSAQWSLPVEEVDAEDNGKTFGKLELVRPLPWIFFLPSLVILRACRMGVNVGAIILGYPELQTAGLVRFVQKSRRRLRTIKSNGLRNMRYRRGYRNKEEELTEAKKSLIKSMLSTLSALSCLENSRRTPSPPPTRVYVQRFEPEPTPTPEEKSTTESMSPQVDPKRKYSEVVELDDSESELQFEEESTMARLDRLAAQDSEADDQDFDPAKEELLSLENDSSEEEEDDEDEDDYISESEVNDVKRTNKLTQIGKVIVEEPEPEPEPKPKSSPELESEESGNKMINANTIIGEKKCNTLQVADDKDDISNFYSPISSPGNSIDDFTSPINDRENCEENITTGLKILSNFEARIESIQLDNGGLNSIDKSPTISSLSSRRSRLDNNNISNGDLILAIFFLFISIILFHHSFFPKFFTPT